METLIVLFLIAVGVFLLVVTFPWGLAILFILGIMTIGLQDTADVAKGVFSLIFQIILGLVGIVFFIWILIAVFK